MRQFCAFRARFTDDAPTDRDLVDYLAGYAEALADPNIERQPGTSPTTEC